MFAHFRLSWNLQHMGGADFRGNKTADCSGKLQETAESCRNPFVKFGLSLLLRAEVNG